MDDDKNPRKIEALKRLLSAQVSGRRYLEMCRVLELDPRVDLDLIEADPLLSEALAFFD